MTKYFFNLAYIGTNLRGVSKNVQEISHCFDSNSISGLLELALANLFPFQPDVYISSRTDAGVHAVNSSAHFTLNDSNCHSCEYITNEVNKYFLKINCDIRVSNIRIVPDDFHARHCARSRTYLYRFAVIKPEAQLLDSKIYGKHFYSTPIVENNRCHFVFNPTFDLEKVQRATEILTGTHDFATFMSSPTSIDNVDKNTVRTINKLEVRPGTPFISPSFDPVVENWNFWELFCQGRSFLYKQVRRFLSTLITVGQGKITVEDVQRMIDEPGKDSWSNRIFLVPPQGLYLLNVEYNPEDFIFKQENAGAALLEERKKKLRATETKVTCSDGRVFVEKCNKEGSREVTQINTSVPGFVVDTKPDLQVGHVLPQLLVGSQDVVADKNLLEALRVTHVLTVGVPGIVLPKDGIKHCFVELLDVPEACIKDKILFTSAFIDNAVNSENGTVFVHCNAGVSRAPTVVMGYLITKRGMPPSGALQLVRRCRPSSKPNEGFLSQLSALYMSKHKTSTN